MLPRYDDILEAMNQAVRAAHYYHYLMADDGHEGKHPQCTTFSYDLIAPGKCCNCVVTPLWWDENGCPRFDAHSTYCPKYRPVHADEVVLLRIACQSCEREFDVQMTWSKTGEFTSNVRAMIRMQQNGMKGQIPTQHLSGNDKNSLTARIKTGTIHYGDPPNHEHENGGTCAGSTMNVWDLRVMEFWRRGLVEWERVPELEIELPDVETMKEGIEP